MQSHTWRGSKLFLSGNSAVDTMSRDIALRHHENWDGTGYPGHISEETGAIVKYNSTHTAAQGLIGEEIPLGARITAIADVYDALSCKRVYKEEWTENKVLEEIKNQRGIKFDPEITDAFLEVVPRLKEIKKRFSESSESPDRTHGQIP